MKLFKINLRLFDGEGEGATAPAAESSGENTVLYGKQSPAAEDTTPTAEEVGTETQENKRTFEDLISGEYKDDYAKSVQKVIDRRFAKSKKLESDFNAQQPIISELKSRYGLSDDASADDIVNALASDKNYIRAEAEKRGITEEQFTAMDRLERENAMLRRINEQSEQDRQDRERAEKWYNEAQSVKEKFADFDLGTELSNENFVALLRSGVPMELAFKSTHFDEFMQDSTSFVAQQTEKAVTDNIKARGSRPKENGTGSKAGFTIKSDPSKLTLDDFNKIAERVRHGEKIVF